MTCITCQSKLIGRTDKKFCSTECRNEHHNQNRQFMKTTQADTWFSRFIRLRDACEIGGALVVGCCTCGLTRDVRYLDCGHYVKRQHLATRFNEKNCQAQCKRCNGFEQGEDKKFAEFIDSTWGDGTAELLKGVARKPAKVNQKLMADLYREKVNELLKERGWQNFKWW